MHKISRNALLLPPLLTLKVRYNTTSHRSFNTLTVEDRTDVPKDNDKPNGDAVNPDGTLKTADEIQWDHSPTASPVKLVSNNSAVTKRRHEDVESDEASTSRKQKKVSFILLAKLLHEG